MNRNAGVLLYNLSGDKGRKLRALCVMQGLRIRAVLPEEYGKQIGFLARLKGFTDDDAEAPEETFSEEMLVFFGFSSSRLDAFLAGMRKNKIPAVALKAVLTEQNSRWNSVQLCRELKKEHEAMKDK